MERRINLSNNDMIIVNIQPFNYCDMITINKGYFENGELTKTIAFNIWDDFSFQGWICEDNELKKLDFCFDKCDPLYIHLERLLDQDDELIIDDDDTYEDMKKIMRIYKTQNNITISFENKLDRLDIIGKFHIFIKNIVTDYRSKIDCNGQNTKIRLIKFFRGIQNEFFSENLEDVPYDKVYKKIKE